MERKLAEFRARKKAQTEAKPAVRVIQSEMKAISDDSPAVSTDTTELKPKTCPQSPRKEVWLVALITLKTIDSNKMKKKHWKLVSATG